MNLKTKEILKELLFPTIVVVLFVGMFVGAIVIRRVVGFDHTCDKKQEEKLIETLSTSLSVNSKLMDMVVFMKENPKDTTHIKEMWKETKPITDSLSVKLYGLGY